MFTNSQPRYIDVHELSARSGLSVSTLRRLKKQGKIPFFQPAGPGGRVLFAPDAIERASQQVDIQQQPQAGSTIPTSRLAGRRPNWMHGPETQT